MTLSKWTSWRTWLLALPLALAAPGQSDAQSGYARGTVFVADGAMGQGMMVDKIGQLITNAQLPLNVCQVNWSTLSEPTDFQSQFNAAVKGKQLAGQIMHVRRTNPNGKIFLVGYGAGTTVILKATESLPPQSVTSIVLMASSVSTGYDLRPALAATCECILAFYSPSDDMLKCAVKKYGPSDMGVRGVTTCAGLTGFQVPNGSDPTLYAKLHQQPVVPSAPDTRAPHSGHLSYEHMKFLRSRVVPVFEASLLGRASPAPYASAYPTPPVPPLPPPCPPQYSPPAPAPQYPPPAPKYSPPAPAPQYPTPAPPKYSPPAPAPQYPAPTQTPQYPTPVPQNSPAPPAPPPPAPQDLPTPTPGQLPPPAQPYPPVIPAASQSPKTSAPLFPIRTPFSPLPRGQQNPTPSQAAPATAQPAISQTALPRP